MKVLAAALVTSTIVVCALVAEALETSDAAGWSTTAGWALFGFVLVLLFGPDR